MICSPITTCSKNAIHIKRHLGTHLSGILPQRSYSISYYNLGSGFTRRKYIGFGVSISGKQSNSSPSNLSTVGLRSCKANLEVSLSFPDVKMKFSAPKHEMIRCNMRNLSLSSSRFAYTGVIVSLLVCYSTSQSTPYAEASSYKVCNSSDDGKRVYTDYSIIGIPGDGRCLFRSVAHGFCLRSGRLAPNENTQRQLADELRTRVADEFVKRRQETEWFVEGDFDTYVTQIREPHVWGGEPELFMASHVLQMPITVYIKDEKAGGLICIAEYGQEYGKEDPIRVLYHGFGHYDALLIHETKLPKSKL